MILDVIKNIDLYKPLHKGLAVGLEYIAKTDFSRLEMGTYKIDGDKVFAILETYRPAAETECKLESHKKYMDIQYMILGEEFIGIAPLSNQEIEEDLLDTDDVVFYKGIADKIKLKAGNFMIFYPTDIHAPSIKVNDSSKVVKVVVKVAV